MNAFCVGCKKSSPMNNPTATTMKNGAAAMTGMCPNCGAKTFKITGGPGGGMAKAAAPAMPPVAMPSPGRVKLTNKPVWSPKYTPKATWPPAQ